MEIILLFYWWVLEQSLEEVQVMILLRKWEFIVFVFNDDQRPIIALQSLLSMEQPLSIIIFLLIPTRNICLNMIISFD